MKKHKQVTLEIHGDIIDVDEGVRDLVLLMNQVPQLQTCNSCQGYKSEADGFAYIQFAGSGALRLLPAIAEGILKEQRSWKKKHQHVCRGCMSMSVALEVNSVGIALRWHPRDYRRVSRILKAACGTARN